MAIHFYDFYQKAIGGDQKSMWQVAYAYLTGDGVEQNIPKAVEWYEKLVELGNEAAAMNYVNIMCYQQQYLPRNLEKAMKICKDFANRGSAQAQEFLAILYMEPEINDVSTAVYWRQKAVDQGYVQSILNMAEMYVHGDGVEVNPTKAIQLLHRAESLAQSTNMYGIAHIYHELDDGANAVKYYTLAAETVPSAQYLLGVFYLQGQYVDWDIHKAIYWFEKAADNGYAEAQAALATCYDTEEYGVQNGLLALKWYNKAIDNGFYDVLHNVANIYANGIVIPRNIDKAIQYYTLSAEKGFVNSQSYLSQIYHDGNICKRE